MKKIPICINCYDNEDEVITFVSSLSMQTIKNSIIVLICCNKCKDINELKENLKLIDDIEIIVYDPKKNLGYLNGALYTLVQVDFDYDYAVISNTDIILADNDYFEIMMSNIESDTWAIGSKIINTFSNSNQNPFMINRPSKIKMYYYKFIYSSKILYVILNMLHNYKIKHVKNKSFENDKDYTYSIHGSIFMVRQELVTLLKDYSKYIFMYGEELLISEIVYKNEKKIQYCNSCVAYHKENQTTSRINSELKRKWNKDSITKIFDLFYK